MKIIVREVFEMKCIMKIRKFNENIKGFKVEIHVREWSNTIIN